MISTSSSEVLLAVLRFPELGELHDRLAQVRRKLSDLSLAAPEDPVAMEAWRKSLVELADDRDELERELRAELSAKGVFTVTPTSESVARGLGEDSAFIGFFRYVCYFERDPETGEEPPGVDSLLAFVVAPDASVRRVELGPSAEIEELAVRWRASLGKPVGRGLRVVVPEGSSETEVGAALRARLLAPCLAVLGGGTPASVHIILDDFLHLVPLDALPWEEGKRVGDVLSIHLEVSTRRLMAEPRSIPEEGTMVALGGVDYDAQDITVPTPRFALATPLAGDSLRCSRTQRHFEPLPHSRLEVEELGELFEQLVGREPVVLTGTAASKKALLELVSQTCFLHVATRGWFAPETLASMLDGAGEKTKLHGLLSRAEFTVHGFVPETLCGLAFRGANHGKDALGRVPGILTAEELATWDLWGCELAVLAGCETNVGLRRAGQGIQSLQGALHAAGVRTAITSLWSVDDEATRRLMELFYTNLWGEGLRKADALWNAKMALRAEGRPPRDWAAWVLSGNPD